MNEQTPTFLSSSHVVLPMSLYKAMAHCYFGMGPRLNEPTPPIAPGPVTAPAPVATTAGGMGGVTTMIPNDGWKLRPMGAARKPEKTDEPRTQQPPQG